MEMLTPSRPSRSDSLSTEAAAEGGRRTLALRLAQRGRLRELRAERLARLRGETGPAAQRPAAPLSAASAPETALKTTTPAENAAREMVPAAAPTPAPAPAPTPGAIPGEREETGTASLAAALDASAALEEFLRALTGGLGMAAPLGGPLEAALEGPLRGLLAALPAGPAAVLPFQRREAPAAAEPVPMPILESIPAPTLESISAPAGARGEAAGDPVSAAVPEGAAPDTDAAAPETDGAADGAAAAGGLAALPGAGPGLVWIMERAGIADLAILATLTPEELAARIGPLGSLVPAERWIARAQAVTEGLSASGATRI